MSKVAIPVPGNLDLGHWTSLDISECPSSLGKSRPGMPATTPGNLRFRPSYLERAGVHVLRPRAWEWSLANIAEARQLPGWSAQLLTELERQATARLELPVNGNVLPFRKPGP
jgi:hypothetical protein